MILFRPEHVEMILSGRKTQTRRLGKRRWKVGGVHACYTRPPFAKGGAEPFARVHILGVRQELLAEISDDDIHAEGYDSFPEYLKVLCDINGGGMSTTALLWVVNFEVVQ